MGKLLLQSHIVERYPELCLNSWLWKDVCWHPTRKVDPDWFNYLHSKFRYWLNTSRNNPSSQLAIITWWELCVIFSSIYEGVFECYKVAQPNSKIIGQINFLISVSRIQYSLLYKLYQEYDSWRSLRRNVGWSSS